MSREGGRYIIEKEGDEPRREETKPPAVKAPPAPAPTPAEPVETTRKKG